MFNEREQSMVLKQQTHRDHAVEESVAPAKGAPAPRRKTGSRLLKAPPGAVVVVAVISEKGGTGKTTMAENLAVQAAASGEEVVLLDIDPQANAARWGDRRERDEAKREEMNPKIISAQYSRLEPTIRTAQRYGATLVIIDGPGHNNPAMEAAAKQADFVLVACRPEINDIETLDLVRGALTVAGNPPAVVAFTQAPSRGEYEVEAGKVAERLYGFRSCPVVTHTLRAYANAVLPGKTASEIDPSGPAAAEVRELYKFTCSQVNKIGGLKHG